MIDAVIFDVDFTIAKPGPDLGPEGYARLGQRFGLELDPARYDDARRGAIATLKRHPELDHDEEVWILFTEKIIEGMGGAGATYECAAEMTRYWERADQFELFDDVLPVLDELRRHELKIGLLSNTSRDLDEFVAHHRLDVDAVLTSCLHGKSKPHDSIFHAMLELIGVDAANAVMVGDDPGDDVEGARAIGMQAWLVDREERFPEVPGRLTDLRALPAALGLMRE